MQPLSPIPLPVLSVLSREHVTDFMEEVYPPAAVAYDVDIWRKHHMGDLHTADISQQCTEACHLIVDEVPLYADELELLVPRQPILQCILEHLECFAENECQTFHFCCVATLARRFTKTP